MTEVSNVMLAIMQAFGGGYRMPPATQAVSVRLPTVPFLPQACLVATEVRSFLIGDPESVNRLSRCTAVK